MGKCKVQETMANCDPPLMGSSSSVVVATSSFQELVVIIVAYTGENLWKTLTCTSTIY
jgi:hypothetical protein